MRRPLFFVLFLFVFTNLFSQTLSTPTIWLKPLLSGDTVSLIDTKISTIDQSPYSKKYTKSYINYNPSITPNDSLNIYVRPYDSLSNNTRVTIMTSYFTESTNKVGLWELGQDTNRLLWLNSQEISYKTKGISYRDSLGTEQGPIVNIGHFTYPKRDTITSLTDTLYICNEGDNHFEGNFGEYLYFPEDLDKTEQQKWESYLALKYGATLKSAYVNSQGDTLWNTKEDSTYSQGIAGVGRDDSTTLNQRRSKIYQDELSINITDNTLQDKTYILWGHNGQNATPTILYQIDTNHYYQMERQWKIKPYTPITNQPANTELIYNYPLNVAPGGILLLINRTSSDITPTISEIHHPDSITTDAVYFKNIHWDTDNNGQDYITIAINIDSLNQPLPNKSEQTQTQQQQNPNEQTKHLSLNLQPNPSRGNFTLIIQQERKTPLQIRITDNNGKEIKKYTKEDADTYTELHETIDTMGIYLIQVTNQDEKKTTKLIIVK